MFQSVDVGIRSRIVVMGVAWSDGVWDFATVAIPGDTPDEQFEEAGRARVLEIYSQRQDEDKVLVGCWLLDHVSGDYRRGQQPVRQRRVGARGC